MYRFETIFKKFHVSNNYLQREYPFAKVVLQTSNSISQPVFNCYNFFIL